MKPANSQFYRDRAEECRLAAADTPLTEVRRKITQAEASWRAMADLASHREKGG